MTETQTKIAAAQEAVSKAAALLLEHAEGLAMLAMVERRREPRNLMSSFEVKDDGMALRNHAANQAWSVAAIAAAEFAGHFEAYQQARNLRIDFVIALQEEVEKLVGFDGAPPPPLSMMPARAGNTELGITPRQVHAQAWRYHLAASASQAALAKAGGRA